MTASTGDDWIIAPRAAELLGVTLHSVYALIDRGQLEAEVTIPTDRPKRRRSIRLRRSAVDEYLERARVKPGELAHMIPPATGRYLGRTEPYRFLYQGP